MSDHPRCRAVSRLRLLPLAVLLNSLTASPAFADGGAGTPAPGQTFPAPKWGAHIDFEAKPGSKRSLGEGDLFVPLMQDERTLFFGNLRARFDDQSSSEGNLGLGVRRMHESGWNFGGYGYFDRRKTESGSYFSQMTFGVEALGRDWDLRANAYLPQGERVRELGTVSTASVSASTVLVSSVTTEERALTGFDAEVGWRVPLFTVDEPRQLRLYAGGYRFKDDVAEVSGPRVRVELTMAQTPWLWRGAQLVVSAEAQDDNVRGGQTFFALRLRIPLGGQKEKESALTWQERRMTAPVMRDVDIVVPKVVRAPVVETATALADGRTFTVLSSATTSGAALPGAVAAAGNNSVVILSGEFNTTGTVSLNFGQTLAGSIAVRTPGGRTAMTPRATIAGTNASSAVQVNAGGTLSGLTISNAFSGGSGGRAVLIAGSSTGVTITNNVITATQSGNNGAVALDFGSNTNGVVSGNTLTVTGSGLGTMTALGMSTVTTATVTGNTISASGGATNNMVNIAGATINSGSTGNVRGSGNCTGAPASGSIDFTNGTTCP